MGFRATALTPLRTSFLFKLLTKSLVVDANSPSSKFEQSRIRAA
jgi:hypothetical protein